MGGAQKLGYFEDAVVGHAFGQSASALAPASAAPAYDPPVLAAPAQPHPGGASPLICVMWLEAHRDQLNEAVGPGGNDPIVRVSGPTATTGSFAAGNITCHLTLTHGSGARETGWLSLGAPALIWTSEH